MIEKFFIICLAILLFGFGIIMTIGDLDKALHHHSSNKLEMKK